MQNDWGISAGDGWSADRTRYKRRWRWSANHPNRVSSVSDVFHVVYALARFTRYPNLIHWLVGVALSARSKGTSTAAARRRHICRSAHRSDLQTTGLAADRATVWELMPSLVAIRLIILTSGYNK